MAAFKIMNRLKEYNTSIIYWWNYHELVVTLNKIVNIIRSQTGCAYYAFNVLYIDTFFKITLIIYNVYIRGSLSNDNKIWRLPLWSCIVVTDANSIGKMRSSTWIYYMLIIWKHIITAKNIVDMLYLNYLGFLHWWRGCRCACLKMDLLKRL